MTPLEMTQQISRMEKIARKAVKRLRSAAEILRREKAEWAASEMEACADLLANLEVSHG